MKKILVILGLVVCLLGVIYALLPHEAHMSLSGGMDNDAMGGEMGEMKEMDHGAHGRQQTIGWVAAVIGLALAVAGLKIFD